MHELYTDFLNSKFLDYMTISRYSRYVERYSGFKQAKPGAFEAGNEAARKRSKASALTSACRARLARFRGSGRSPSTRSMSHARCSFEQGAALGVQSVL